MLAANAHQFVVLPVGQLGSFPQVAQNLRSVPVLVQILVQQQRFNVEHLPVRVGVLVQAVGPSGANSNDFPIRKQDDVRFAFSRTPARQGFDEIVEFTTFLRSCWDGT